MKNFNNIAVENQTVANVIYSKLNAKGKRLFNSMFNTDSYPKVSQNSFNVYMNDDLATLKNKLNKFECGEQLCYGSESYFYTMMVCIINEKAGMLTNDEANKSVKKWYKKFSNDTLANEINPNITFADIYNTLKNGEANYIYSLIPADSVVRETIFKKVAEIYNTTCNEIYNMW